MQTIISGEKTQKSSQLAGPFEVAKDAVKINQ